MIKIRTWLFLCMVQSGLLFSCLANSVLVFMDVSEHAAAYHYSFFPALFRDKWYVFDLVTGIVLLLSLIFSFHRLIDVSRNKGIEISEYEECVIVGTSIIDIVFVHIIMGVINWLTYECEIVLPDVFDVERLIFWLTYKYEIVLPEEVFGVARYIFWVSITDFILSFFVFRGIRKTKEHGTGDAGPGDGSMSQSDG